MTLRLASSFQLPDAAARPEDVPGVMLALPTYRFWGTQKPPKAAVFQMLTNARASGAGSSATIRVYGPIDSWGGFWGVSAEEVSQALDTLPAGVETIQLRINSPGGEVFEAMAILNMLRAHPARTVAVVDGIAASAASFLAAGCDETVMSPGTQMMIHDARTFAYGPPAVMRKVADVLDSLSSSAADLYAEAAGGTSEKWRALMVEETWYTAKEAVTAGLADSVGVVADAAIATTAGEDPEEQAEDPAPAPAPAPATAQLPEGVVAIESTVLEDLRAGAEAGRAARERQATEDRDRAITAAVSSGRIPPARRAHWQSLWDADPAGTASALEALEPGLIPVSELGTTQDGDGGESASTPAEDAALEAYAHQMGIPKEALL